MATKTLGKRPEHVGFQYDIEVVPGPDEPEENARWREWALDVCSKHTDEGRQYRKVVMAKCRKSFWYFAHGFCYVHEARILDEDVGVEDLDTKVPFLAWVHQIPVVNHILKVLGKRDFRLVKSRAQGATWLMILIAVWLWLFHRGAIVNFVSKDEKAVDEKGNMNSIFAKIDWLLPLLPVWMVGKKGKHWFRNHSDHTFTRADGETAITGYACTPNVATGGRALVFFMDEHAKHPQPQDADAMASTQPVSYCRGSISTPWGMGGEFARIIHDKTIDEPVLTLAWWDNPVQNRGLYRVVKGVPVAVNADKYGPLHEDYQDPEKWFRLKQRLEERGYDLTNNQYRSPWYDEECLRQGANPTLVAQEYDMHFGASVARYFSDALVNRLLNQITMEPVRGEFIYDPETLTGRWEPNPDGRFKLWVELDLKGRPPMGEYIVASDVAAGRGGTGGSNSTITVFNRRTGRKVLAFATPTIDRHVLAETGIALCRWFVNYRGDPAFLNWEANGYGGDFTQRVERSDFMHYYRRKPSKDAPLNARHTDKAGWWTWKLSALLGPYMEALVEGYFDNQDRDAIKELEMFEMGPDGEPYHRASKDKTDPSGAGAAHGDRVVADAVAWISSVHFGDQHDSFYSRNKPNVMNIREGDAARGTAAHRRAVYLDQFRKARATKSGWRRKKRRVSS